MSDMSDTREPLVCTIRQQDGALVEMRYADTITNRQFVDYVRRHEAYGGNPQREGWAD